MPQSAAQRVATHSKRVRCVELAAQSQSCNEIARPVGYSNRDGANEALAAVLLGCSPGG